MDGMVRQSELVGKGLMAYETTEEVGVVEHLLVDVKRSHTTAITYKAPGLMSRSQSVSWKNLVSVGDRIIIHTQPATDEAELAASQNMTGLEVWTDGGDRIGTLIDLCVEKETGKVQKYLFELAHEQAEADEPSESVMAYAIEPQMIISAGRKRMMIAEEDAKRSQSHGELIKRIAVQKTSARQAPVLPTEIPKDFDDFLQKGKSLAERAAQQAKVRAKQFADEHLANQSSANQSSANQSSANQSSANQTDIRDGAADLLPDVSEQLQEKTQQAKQQIQQQLNRAARRAKREASQRAEQAKEQIDGQLGKSPLGRSLGKSLNQAIDKFKRPSATDGDPIDVDAFEVWEDD